MTVKSFLWLFVFLIFSGLFSIRSEAQNTFEILDSAKCAVYITHDTVDNFFERVQPLEASILLKERRWKDSSQAAASKALIYTMREFTMNPSKTQKNILQRAMAEAMNKSAPFLKSYPLPTIQLGLIKGFVYGPSVFYTRENGIYIPEAMVTQESEKELTQILIHEIFHIQSRNYPGLQEKIYDALGFIKLDEVPTMPAAFRSRILLNPDGTDWNFAIPLQMQENKQLAYPMIVSKEKSFQPDMPNFFAYLKFQLYPLQTLDEGYRVTYDGDLDGLPRAWFETFFSKITNNTQYIIHPDELAADNFVLLTRRNAGEELGLSPNGQQLLDRIETHYQ